jgi:hypothetical protein
MRTTARSFLKRVSKLIPLLFIVFGYQGGVIAEPNYNGIQYSIGARQLRTYCLNAYNSVYRNDTRYMSRVYGQKSATLATENHGVTATYQGPYAGNDYVQAEAQGVNVRQIYSGRTYGWDYRYGMPEPYKTYFYGRY